MENANRVVSSEAEELILVDADDNETGFLSKAECHDGHGRLHRAFSVFLFNDAGELLLQQRARSKRLWPGFWSNTCCSHPRRGESMDVATRRRLRDELNIEARVEFVYKFQYRAEFGDLGSENELCHVFVGRVSGHIKPNENEIAAVRFVSPSVLDAELSRMPEIFSPWFKMEWQALTSEYRDQLARHCSPQPSSAAEQGSSSMDNRESNNDFVASPLPFWLLWGGPIVVLLSLNVFRLPLTWTAGIFAACFAWMGVGCAINARRCRRRHCYYSSPVLLVGALLTLLVGLGYLDFGQDGFMYVTWGTFAGVLLTFLPERLFGKYKS